MKFQVGDKVIIVREEQGYFGIPTIGLKGVVTWVEENFYRPEKEKPRRQKYHVKWEKKYWKKIGHGIDERFLDKYIEKPLKKAIRKKIKHYFKVGELVKDIKTNQIGRIRHIGILKRQGISQTTIWSEWETKWNQLVLPLRDKYGYPTIDGQLIGISPLNCKLLDGKEKITYLNKHYSYMFKDA